MRICKLILIALVILVTSSFAGTSVQDLSKSSLGLEYNGTLRGQFITAQDVPARVHIQSLNFYYAPVEYGRVMLGIGADRFFVDRYSGVQFNGDYGFSPSLGLSLFTPFFLDHLIRITGGVTIGYLNSEDHYHYIYSGLVVNPTIGFIFSPAPIFDLDFGYRGHIISGTMENSSVGTFSKFSNRTVVRGYVSATIHSPITGAYITFDGDVSPQYTNSWHQGPLEASLGISVGFILRTVAEENNGPDDSPYFPAYKEMKKKQKKMAAEVE